MTFPACTPGAQPPAAHPASAPSGEQGSPTASVRDGAEPGGGASAAAGEEAEAAQPGLPTECETRGDLCLPPADFVERLCRAAHIGTAVRLFAKSSPFTRGYVRMREVPAINLRGGPASEVKLTFAEEVLLLARHGGSDGMQVSGVGGYDVLRWDGTCATLSSDELVLRVPAPPRHAPFAWKYLDDSIQRALLQNEAVRSAHDAERKRCTGTSSARESASCRDASARLNDRVVVAIRTGLELPSPEYTP